MPSRAPDPLTALTDTISTSQAHHEFVIALRERNPRRRYRVPIAGRVVHLGVTPGPAPSPSPARIVAAWAELHTALTDLADQPHRGCDALIHPGMPPEIAVAIWRRKGHRVYACGSEDAARALRTTRRRGPRAWAPLPLLAAIGDRVASAFTLTAHTAAGGATAVTLAVIPPIPADLDTSQPPTPPAVPTTAPAPARAQVPALTPPTVPRCPAPPDPRPDVASSRRALLGEPTPLPTPSITAPTPPEPALPEPTLPLLPSLLPTPDTTEPSPEPEPSTRPSPVRDLLGQPRTRPRHDRTHRPERKRPGWLNPGRSRHAR